MKDAVLWFLLNYCATMVVNILAGRPIDRLGRWIATYGEPKQKPYRPFGYTEGSWL